MPVTVYTEQEYIKLKEEAFTLSKMLAKQLGFECSFEWSSKNDYCSTCPIKKECTYDHKRYPK